MPTDKKISQLPLIGTPARANVLTALDALGANVRGLVSSWLALVLDTDLTFADVTTGNVSTSKHGYFPKLPSGVVSNLLAVTTYSPAQATVSTTSTTLTAVDVTNLSITFTVPTSGKVLVRLSAYADISTTVQQYFWGLLDNAGALVSGVSIGPLRDNLGLTWTGAMLVSGLTPGASLTWRWAHAVTGGATGRLGYGPGITSTTVTTAMWGPAIMEIWAA